MLTWAPLVLLGPSKTPEKRFLRFDAMEGGVAQRHPSHRVSIIAPRDSRDQSRELEAELSQIQAAPACSWPNLDTGSFFPAGHSLRGKKRKRKAY